MSAIDAAHLAHQREWSRTTFGPGPRTQGVLDHIRKELAEIEAKPDDLSEWVDVIILAFDGAWRAGWDPQEIIDAIKAKQAKNEAREWPDWRAQPEDRAIEHVRGGDMGTPKRYRKKPVEIEAVQFHPTANREIVVDWISGFGQSVDWDIDGETGEAYLTISTLEGRMRANSSDWIIRGVQGEFYLCKPDIFEATYVEVDSFR